MQEGKSREYYGDSGLLSRSIFLLKMSQNLVAETYGPLTESKPISHEGAVRRKNRGIIFAEFPSHVFNFLTLPMDFHGTNKRHIPDTIVTPLSNFRALLRSTEASEFLKETIVYLFFLTWEK